eukprot:tig00021127_g18691.t1
MMNVRIRPASVQDVPVIVQLLRDLAEFEQLEEAFKCDEDSMRRALFGPRPYIEALIAESVDTEGDASSSSTSSPLKPAFHHPRTSSQDPSVLASPFLPRTYTAAGAGDAELPQQPPAPSTPQRPALDPELGVDRRAAEPGDVEEGFKPVGCAIFYFTFSTFACRPNLYVEDVYVKPAARARGVGTKLFAAMAQIALQRECGRMEWSVLRWNQKAIGFYSKLGATPNEAWEARRPAPPRPAPPRPARMLRRTRQVYRLEGGHVGALAGRLRGPEGRLVGLMEDPARVERPLSLRDILGALDPPSGSGSRRHSLT